MAKPNKALQNHMSNGIKHDQDKPRWDLLPIIPIADCVDIFTQGAKKYGDYNWQRLENGRERCYAALMRHLCKWRKGEAADYESGKSHLAHVMVNAMFIMFFDLQNNDKEQYNR